MRVLEPVQKTRADLRAQSQTSGPTLERSIHEVATAVTSLVPSCVAVSITIAEMRHTFTLMASRRRPARQTPVQYVDGGPCVDAALTGSMSASRTSPDEDRWHQYAHAVAAPGIRSSLSVPITRDDRVIGAVNLYPSDPRAFVGKVDASSAVVGSPHAVAAANADASFRTRTEARSAPHALAERDVVEQDARRPRPARLSSSRTSRSVISPTLSPRLRAA